MSKKNKVKRIPTAVNIDPDLHAQAKIIFAAKKTNFSREVNAWLTKFVKANLADTPTLVQPPVDKVPEEEKVEVTKVEVPAMFGKKPEVDWF